MNRQSPLLLLLLLLFIFSPTLFTWVLSTDGAWYRPYFIWLVIVIIAYFVQRSTVKPNDF